MPKSSTFKSNEPSSRRVRNRFHRRRRQHFDHVLAPHRGCDGDLTLEAGADLLVVGEAGQHDLERPPAARGEVEDLVDGAQ
jgi:hypothetical protein